MAMRLSLLEPCLMNQLLDRPHLGCAMLIAACGERGIAATLVKAQTRYLRDMFVNDSDELWDLIEALDDSEAQALGIAPYREWMRRVGLAQFRSELAELYGYVYERRSPRHLLHGPRLERMRSLHELFARVYAFHVGSRGRTDLRFVDRYVAAVLETKPDAIGVSLQGGFGALSRAVRRRLRQESDAPVIVGGALTPYLDESSLSELFEAEEFDYLVIGAGDRALPSLLETLASGGDGATIPNVRMLRGGAVCGAGLEVVDDLGALPIPDFDQFEIDRYLSAEPILPLQTARGCTWSRCAFCSHHTVFQSRYKAAGIDWVVEALGYLRRTHGVDHFALHDIELPPRRAEALADAILAEPGLKGITLSAYARLIGGYANDRRLRRLADAGFSTFEWGLESGCERVLDSMNKGTHVATMERVLRHSAAAGISNQCFLLFGFPGETVQEADATVEFVMRNKEYIDRIGLSLLAVYPGSDLHKDPRRWGIELADDGTHATTEGMSAEAAESCYRRLKRDYAMNPDKYTSDRVNCLLQGTDSRMFHFLHRSHDVLPGDDVAALVAARGEEGVYPVVLGEIVAAADGILYAPVSAGESPLINLVRPPTPVEVDDLQRLVVHLADGRSSVAEILAAVEAEGAGGGDGADPMARALAFLVDVFGRGWALAYGRRWA